MTNQTRRRSSFAAAIALPAAVKVVCAAILAVLVVSVWQQYAELDTQTKAMASWEKVQDYAIFYPRRVGDDHEELTTGGDASTIAEARDLFPALERKGALYVEATNYRAGRTPPSSLFPVPPMQVNTNFLAQYPIKDETGEQIVVADDEQDWVVAVPARYKAREAELREAFKIRRAGTPDSPGLAAIEEKMSGVKPPERFVAQPIRFIWMAAGQQVFSFDPEINPEQGNMITDPIVEIMTPANSLTIDRMNAVTGTINTGLKVRVDGDPAAVLAEISPLIKQLKLDDNLTRLVSVHDAIGTDVAKMRSATTQAVAFAAGALLVVVVLTATTVVIGSDRLRRRLTVRRLHGIGVTRSYRELLVLLGGTWLVQTVLAAVALTLFAPGQQPKLLSVALATLVVEVLFVVVTAQVIERRNAVKRLKEL